MPSEHSAHAFAAAAVLARQRGWRPGLPDLLDAALVGYGRERARKHHWYDVAAGAVVGAATALATDKLVGWFFARGIPR